MDRLFTGIREVKIAMLSFPKAKTTGDSIAEESDWQKGNQTKKLIDI
jgi:hypothetical protein